MTDEGQTIQALIVLEELEVRRNRSRLKVKKPAPALGLFYGGSKRLASLPDGREAWSCWIAGRGFVTMYEVPICESDLHRLRARLEKARG